MECENKKERFFIGLIEDGETLKGFDWIESPEFVAFFPGQVLTKKNFFGCCICETPDHEEGNTPKSEQGKYGIRFFCLSVPMLTEVRELDRIVISCRRALQNVPEGSIGSRLPVAGRT